MFIKGLTEPISLVAKPTKFKCVILKNNQTSSPIKFYIDHLRFYENAGNIKS